MSISNKFSGHQFIDVVFGEVGVEAPIELGEGGLFRKAGCLEAGLSQAGFSVIQFILNQTGKDLDESSPLVSLDDAGVQGGDHTVESEDFEMSFQFSRRHYVPPFSS